MTTFDQIIPPEDRRTVMQGLMEISFNTVAACITVLNLHTFLRARIDGPSEAVDTSE